MDDFFSDISYTNSLGILRYVTYALDDKFDLNWRTEIVSSYGNPVVSAAQPSIGADSEGGIQIAYVRSDLGDLKYVYKAPTIFSDDFEAGGTSRWSNTVP